MRLHPDVAFEYINPAGERVFGYPLEQLRQADREFILNLLADDDQRAGALETMAGRFNTTQLRRWRRADGEEIWTEQHVMPIYDGTGRLVAIEGVGRDVTDRERAMNTLRTIEERERRLIESLPDLVMRLDESGTFVEHVSTASKQPTKVFMGKSLQAVVSAEQATAAGDAIKRAVAGTPSSFRGIIDVWGDERTYEVRLIPTGSGELLAFLRDITDEVWAAGEDARRRARDEIESTVDEQIGIRNPYHLTFREFTVLHLVARGAADKEIANELGIANSTVNKHVSNILGKMGASSRTEAGVRAVQEGLARP